MKIKLCNCVIIFICFFLQICYGSYCEISRFVFMFLCYGYRKQLDLIPLILLANDKVIILRLIFYYENSFIVHFLSALKVHECVLCLNRD